MNLNFKYPEAFHFLWTSKARFKVLKGGAGSGKSESAMRYVFTRFISEPGCNVIATRKVDKTIELSLYPSFIGFINDNNLRHIFKCTKRPFRIVCKLNNNTIAFTGMDDPEKIKSVKFENGNAEIILMEEASEHTKEDLNQLNVRLRGNTGIRKEIIVLFNPISEDHWLKTEFWDKNSYPDCYLSETNYLDNPFLDDVYKKELENFKEHDPYYYQVYCLGDWGSIGEFDTIIPYPIIYKALKNEIKNPVGGLDVGLDPARFGDDEIVAYIRRGYKILDKMVISKKEKLSVTNKQMGVYIAEKVLNMIAKYRKKTEEVRIKIDIGSGDSAAEAFYSKRLQNIEIFEISFGGKAKNEDKYSNCATEMYFEASELIPKLDLIKDDKQMFSELSRRKFTYDSKVRKKIEPKDKFKDRINRSPDNADAFVLCLYNPKEFKKKEDISSFYW